MLICKIDFGSVLKWMRGLQALTCLVLPLVAAAALYRSSAIYHPRRRAILHLKSLKKTKKQQREFEDKPPYFDWTPLRMRSMQVLMVSCAQTALGTFTPFALVVGERSDKENFNFVQAFLKSHTHGYDYS